MAESQENDSNAKKPSFDIKFRERGKRDPKTFYRQEYYRNQIKGVKEAGLNLNQEVRKNFKKIAVEFGEITGNKEEISKTDPLTKILNRRGFDEALKTKMEESRRFKFPLTLISIDVNNFKILNDTLGHAKGDKLLILIANTVKNNKRKIDVWGRVGGDEFNLLLPSANPENAELKMKEIENKVKEKIDSKFPRFNLGLSYGIYQWDGKEDFNDFLKKADDKLYEMKRQKHG